MTELQGNKNRFKLLYLLQILQEETDEEHPLSGNELCDRLHALGIPCERKAVYRDIASLNQFGYEIISTRQPKQGYFLAQRALDVPEVRLLLDAVASAPFITEKKTKELSEKLCRFLSNDQARLLSQQLSGGSAERIKFDNEEVYYNIDAIHRAIQKGCKVQFSYYHKQIVGGKVRSNGGRTFCVSPYAMVWNEDKYYLVGNYEKYDNLSNYRIDRMRRVTLLETKPIRPYQEISPDSDTFHTAEYLRSTFSMFGSEPEQDVTFSCDLSLLEAMTDRFGKLEILESDDKRFTFRAKVRTGDGFYQWALHWGNQLVVLEPVSVQEEIMDRIRDLADAYCAL